MAISNSFNRIFVRCEDTDGDTKKDISKREIKHQRERERGDKPREKMKEKQIGRLAAQRLSFYTTIDGSIQFIVESKPSHVAKTKYSCFQKDLQDAFTATAQGKYDEY
ncbi:Hypothetical predicted protein [Octopus vulgaris]|uniref:Uncharacterized protein n=1 Tax=Octopus vulgaris TaxID=6645 RepID=A0AA36AZ12_OCTVU|nr:Hypothetical predicted protein [Octopus vulgaris]